MHEARKKTQCSRNSEGLSGCRLLVLVDEVLVGSLDEGSMAGIQLDASAIAHPGDLNQSWCVDETTLRRSCDDETIFRLGGKEKPGMRYDGCYVDTYGTCIVTSMELERASTLAGVVMEVDSNSLHPGVVCVAWVVHVATVHITAIVKQMIENSLNLCLLHSHTNNVKLVLSVQSEPQQHQNNSNTNVRERIKPL